MSAQKKFCYECSALIVREATRCRVCGAGQPDLAGFDAARLGPHPVSAADDAPAVLPQRRALPEPIRVPRFDEPFGAPPKRLEADRTTAGLLALFLGGVGAHRFYTGRWGLGIVYLVFAWTFVPAIVALVEAIVMFSMTDEDFSQVYG